VFIAAVIIYHAFNQPLIFNFIVQVAPVYTGIE